MAHSATLILSIIFTCTLCSVANPLAGRHIPLPVHKTPRIRGGVPAGPDEIPYAAGLMIQTPIGNRWCGGSLVSVNYVLTAANCFTNPGATTVLLGASNMTNVEDIVIASDVIVHQAFVPSQNLNDIALVRLSRPANITNYIRLARLPNWRQADSLFVNQLATVSGWGALGQNSPEILPLNNLHRINGSVITNTACSLQYLGGIAESHVCVSTSNGSPCLGDQGGPLTVDDADGGQTLIGVFSFLSVLGCDVDRPAVYTRLTPFLAWIEANSDVTIRNDFEFFPTAPGQTTTTAVTTTSQPITTTTQFSSESPTSTVSTTEAAATTTTFTTDFTTESTTVPATTTTDQPPITTTQAILPPHRTHQPNIRVYH
ncbi:collagenase-like [Anopheles maculipalpis]|uniref:collagenase-like n=1 Tax=Anopheles maculipalpis TaxID=1496333 RepID=UPI002158A4EC|nr:collagenase-like [Anopheles maculipalpis]